MGCGGRDEITAPLASLQGVFSLTLFLACRCLVPMGEGVTVGSNTRDVVQRMSLRSDLGAAVDWTREGCWNQTEGRRVAIYYPRAGVPGCDEGPGVLRERQRWHWVRLTARGRGACFVRGDRPSFFLPARRDAGYGGEGEAGIVAKRRTMGVGVVARCSGREWSAEGETLNGGCWWSGHKASCARDWAQ